MAGKIQATSKTHAATCDTIASLIGEEETNLAALALAVFETKALEKLLKSAERKGVDPSEVLAERKEAIRLAKLDAKKELREQFELDADEIKRLMKLVG